MFILWFVTSLFIECETQSLNNPNKCSGDWLGSSAIAKCTFLCVFSNLHFLYLLSSSNEVAVRDGVLVILDMHADPELVAEGVARGIASRFQKMRKTLGLTPTDPVGYFFDILKSPKERTDVTSLYSVLSNKRELVESLAKNRLLPKGRRPLGTVALRKEVHTIEGEEVELEVTRECLVFAKTVPANVQLVVGSMDVKRAVAELERAGELTVSVDGQKHTLKWGQDVLRF
eukprot:c17611_g1_i2.p1 GENE.c17611_g1_i2~~c17611_g1_i2.p1  ORF type:complete len:230 (+),score=47.89 c17611_g1_i2:62-751(+)